MTTRAPLDPFETALLLELRRHVVTRRAAPDRSRRRRRLGATGAGFAAAAAATVGALILRPEAAFAVDPQADGDVVVTITNLEDADGLERALADQGVDAEVDYSAEPLVPPVGPDGGTHEQDGPAVGGSDYEMDHEASATVLCGDVPRRSADPEPLDISIESTGDGVRFTLSEAFVASDAGVAITTSGEDGAAGIRVDVQHDCAADEDGGTQRD